MDEKNQTSIVKEEKAQPSANKKSERGQTETKQKLEEVKKKVEENLASAVEKEVSKTEGAPSSKEATPKKDSKEKSPAVPTLEREYTVPLRAKWMKAVRYKKTNKAIRSLKEFLARHMKVYDRDLNKIKLDKHLNEFIWARGIKNPPARVKVKAVKEGDLVRVELLSPSENLKRKKERLEKRSERAVESASKKIVKEETTSPAKEVVPGTAGLPETTEDKKEASEKKTAVVETGREQAKSDAKTAKHMTKGKSSQPKHQPRKALKK